MKKLFITALLAATVAVSASASDGNKINSAAVNNFEVAFKKASDVSWTANKYYVKATFVLDNTRMEALYDLQGDFIGTTKGITLEELPVNAKRTFAKKYGSYTVKEAIRFEGNEEGAYFISADNEKESVILKVNDNSTISVMKYSKK